MLVRFTLRSYMLVRFYIADLIDCTRYVNEPKIKLLKSKQIRYLGIVTSSFPACQASCELVFPLVVLTPKSLKFSLRLISRFVAGRAKRIVTLSFLYNFFKMLF